MNGKSEYTPNSIRDAAAINGIINAAIKEVVDAFGTDMADRDRSVLEAVIEERETDPFGRVQALLKYRDAVDVSEKITDDINQVLQTLRQKLTDEEKLQFRSWKRGGSILDDIV